MGYTFDGANKIITLTSGTTSISVRDLWSRWYDWWVLSNNSKYPLAFTNLGGDTIDASAGTFIPIYLFLQNGWRIRPQEANHTLNVGDGILLVAGGGDPFLSTLGAFTVRINYQQPVQAISFGSGGGGISAELALMLEQFLTIEGFKDGVVAENSASLRRAGSVQLQISGYGTGFTTVEKI